MKRILKLFVSMGFLTLSRLRACVSRLAGREGKPSCMVLYYHSISPEQRQHFARQMDMLVAYATPIAVDIKEQLTTDRFYAAVTFDDGFRTFAQNALPELQKRRIPSTMFVVSGCMGQNPSWLTESYLDNQTEITMSVDELLSMPQEWVTFGSHTVTHPPMTKLSAQTAKDELVNSRRQLERSLGRSITLFSFPYGLYNQNLLDWCREAGYQRVFTIEPSFAFSEAQEYVVGRVSVDPPDWPLEFWLKLRGAYNWEPRASSLKKKLTAVVRRRSRAPEAVKESVVS
jgi:peptidoglycan/xylan/chitin deacetylase (PgdA/CDA1 family)